MRFFSIVRLALHNLNNNKLRTLLTIVVLGVVSLVVVFLAGMAYSFYRSTEVNISTMFQTEPTSLSIEARVKEKNQHGYREYSYYTTDEVKQLLDKLESYDDGYLSYISTMYFSDYGLEGNESYVVYGAEGETFEGYSSSIISASAFPIYTKSNPFVGRENYLIMGRMWTAEDAGKDYVWVSESMMGRYGIGDKITVATEDMTNRYNNTGKSPYIVHSTLEIAGFLDVGGYQDRLLMDYTKFDQIPEQRENYWSNSGLYIRTVYGVMVPQADYLYGSKAQTFFKTLRADLEGTDYSHATPVTGASTLEMIDSAYLMYLIVIGLVAIISLIIIMLSIGSVANTIKISAEQNRKFFGVMKAIGMKNKSLRQVLIGQIVIMTIIGVAIASVGVYLGIGLVESIISSLINSMFYSLAEPTIICTVSPLIPAGVALFLIGFVLLFTRKNLKAFSRMDVISVINEVN